MRVNGTSTRQFLVRGSSFGVQVPGSSFRFDSWFWFWFVASITRVAAGNDEQGTETMNPEPEPRTKNLEPRTDTVLKRQTSPCQATFPSLGHHTKFTVQPLESGARPVILSEAFAAAAGGIVFGGNSPCRA
jgi:hypothetical protein